MNYATRVMNILISIGSLGLGGAEKQAVWLANRLSLDHEVSLFTYHGGKREVDLSQNVKWIKIFDEVESKGSSVSPSMSRPVRESFSHKVLKFMKNNFYVRTQIKWILSLLKKSAKKSQKYKVSKILFVPVRVLNETYIYRKARLVLKDSKPDLVITFLFHDTLNVGLASVLKFQKPKLIVGRRSPIGYGDDSRGLIHKRILRFIYGSADMGISNSIANIESAIKDGLSKSKIRIIPNYVTSPALHRNQKQSSDNLKLVCIANMHWYKNHRNLVLATSRVIHSGNHISLTLIGDGPLFTEIFELSSDLGLSIDFRGFEDNPSASLQEFDAAILVSYFEGSSNAVLEALISGIPVISSNTGSVSELISSGAPIVLCDPNDIESIANATRFLKDNYEHYSGQARSYSQYLKTAYGEDRIFSLWNKAIRDVTSE